MAHTKVSFRTVGRFVSLKLIESGPSGWDRLYLARLLPAALLGRIPRVLSQTTALCDYA
jgi:hypothetical protein